MSDELKMEGVETPSLTLDPFADAQSKPELTLEVPQAKAVEQVVEENPLTPEEQRMVDEFARQININ
ncbi:MAG: toxic anion resistance protein, partial [Eubacterium sp.]